MAAFLLLRPSRIGDAFAEQNKNKGVRREFHRRWQMEQKQKSSAHYSVASLLVIVCGMSAGTNSGCRLFSIQASQATMRTCAMGFFSRDIKTMDDLFVHTLRDIYYAERQILQALPDMIEKANDPQLKQAFHAHLAETRNQVTRLDQVFRLHGQEPSGVDCPAIDGIIEEADEVAGEVDDSSVLDAALIAAAQAVEHYEITRYGILIAWARELGRNDCAQLLQQNLEEEKAADKKLTAMAESRVNRQAA
jgi:ferritin-like metal-binding protein YciE